MTQTERVLNAVRRGHKTGPEISRAARVPKANVHPLLGRLRKRGQVEGFGDEMRAT